MLVSSILYAAALMNVLNCLSLYFAPISNCFPIEGIYDFPLLSFPGFVEKDVE